MKERCIGVKITPEMFESMCRNGFHAKLIDNEIPDTFKLKTYGFDMNTNCFFLIFTTDDCPEGIGVQEWIVPIYRKE